jgi:4-amino-4-deoxy-L-arabinose transferase-like glycosyltransferase
MTRIGRAWPVLVLGVALAVRLWGIGWQLPAALYFDEMKYADRASATVRGQPPDIADFRNPTLFRHVLEAEYRLANLVHASPDVREAAVFQLGLARITSAILGSLACLLAALAAARLPVVGPRLAGLATGLILALAPLEVHLAHYAVNDAPASFVMAACLLFGARALAVPNSLDLLLAGLLAGLAAATKYNFGVVLVLPLVAAMRPMLAAALPSPAAAGEGLGEGASLSVGGAGGARWSAKSDTPTGRSRRGGTCPNFRGVRATLRYLALTLGGFAIGLALGMPEILTSPALVAAGIAEQARLGTIRWNGQSDAPVWQLYGEALVKGLGWPVLLLAVGGAIVLWRRDRLAALGVLAVPAACLTIMLRQELFFARFALPLLPLLALLAGVGIGALAEAAGRRLKPVASAALTLVVLALVLLPSTLATVRHDQLATTTDTRILAQRWLEEQAGGARVVTEVYGLPISWTGSVAPPGYRLQRTASLADPAAIRRLACDGVRYFVQASLTSEREVARRGAPAGGSGYDLLARSGRIAATFDPFWPGLQAPAHPDDTGIPFWHQDAYERPGPKITIVEVPEGAISCAQ